MRSDEKCRMRRKHFLMMIENKIASRAMSVMVVAQAAPMYPREEWNTRAYTTAACTATPPMDDMRISLLRPWVWRNLHRTWYTP